MRAFCTWLGEAGLLSGSVLFPMPKFPKRLLCILSDHGLHRVWQGGYLKVNSHLSIRNRGEGNWRRRVAI